MIAAWCPGAGSAHWWFPPIFCVEENLGKTTSEKKYSWTKHPVGGVVIYKHQCLTGSQPCAGSRWLVQASSVEGGAVAVVNVACMVCRALPHGHSKVCIVCAGTGTGVEMVADRLHPLTQLLACRILGCGSQLLLHTCEAIQRVKALSSIWSSWLWVNSSRAASLPPGHHNCLLQPKCTSKLSSETFACFILICWLLLFTWHLF